jgi:hypothetical protein
VSSGTKIDEEKTQAISFSRQLRVHEEVLQIRRGNIPCVNNVKYLGVILYRRMKWCLLIEMTVVKTLNICRIHSFSKVNA